MRSLTTIWLFIFIFSVSHFICFKEADGSNIPVTVIAKDIKDKTVKGIRFIVLNNKAVSAPTIGDGITKILIPADYASGKNIEIQIHQTDEDWVFISPWDDWITVPESGGYCKIILARHGDREALVNGDAVRAMTAGILAKFNEQATTEQTITEELRRKVLQEQAKRFGFSPKEIDRAIREFSKKAKDPYDVGITALYERNYPQATKKLTESLQFREKKEAEVREDVADAAYFLGQSLYEQDRYKEAAINYRKALLRRPNDASILNSLGIVNFIIGEVEKAVEYYQKALVIDQEIGYRQGEANQLGNLGLAYRAMGEVEKAVEYLRQALKIFEEIKSPYADLVRKKLNDLTSKK
jgi:tetratricopeptide (TPR) repeat protein